MGWSCGKETLKDGRYDTLKGSYYANPVQNPSLHAKAIENYPSLPEYTAPNVWPAEDVLPGFEVTFQQLCDFIIETAGLVARACDSYAVEHVPDYQPGYLEHVVKSSISTKARLLHYFPAAEAAFATAGTSSPTTGQSSSDDWCATHLDHGCLTGLTSAMFIDESQTPLHDVSSTWYEQHQQQRQEPQHPLLLPELDRSPDPTAGLYIHSRSGAVTKVNIPKASLAFQTGEALQVITQGRFRAVPHFVKGVAPEIGRRVARNTLAVFTQVCYGSFFFPPTLTYPSFSSHCYSLLRLLLLLLLLLLTLWRSWRCVP